MIDAVLQVGDEVVITIPQENREWGYNPCPDGTQATVLGFSEIKYGRLNTFGHEPGVFVSRAWTKVRLESGYEYTEFTGRLEMVDKTEYERRVTEWQARREGGETEPKEFLRDLPETPFCEGDKVCISRTHLGVTSIYGPDVPDETEPEGLVVVRIGYHDLTNTRKDGSSYPAYHVSDKLGGGWDTAVSVEEMELVERGNVWKYFHDEPLEFVDLREEATFFRMLGHTDEVRNPDSGLYSWTKDEVLEAIKNGIVDAFTMGGSLFGSSSSISAIKFRDEVLGRRVAAMTLEGFGLNV